MVTTIEMMKARENRALIQQSMINKYNLPIVYFSMNIPGPVKTNELFRYAFEQGKKLLLAQIELERIEIVYQDTIYSNTGDEFYLVCNKDALTLKKIGVFIEEIDNIGRLFDVDIIKTDLQKVERSELGLQPRKCLICDNPALICARSRSHSVEEMVDNIKTRITNYKKEQFVNEVSEAGLKALLYEVSITPKPGLVDRKDNGSHLDMNFYSFIDSSVSLNTSLKQFVQLGLSTKVIDDNTIWNLKGIGKEAERKMLLSTGNVNTHKGAIFSLGLFLFSASFNYQHLTIETLRNTLSELSKGYKLSHPYINEELEKGYPTVFELALPIYTNALEENLSIDEAGVKTFLHIITHCDDSNIVKRSNKEKAKEIKENIKELLNVNREYESIAEILNREFISENISAGGSADLLMLTIFSYLLFK